MLTLITKISDRHRENEEFKLGFQLLQESLPENSNIIDINRLDLTSSVDLLIVIRKQLNDFVLILKEPSVFLSSFAIKEMISLLQETDFKCIIPSTGHFCRKGHDPYFFSLNTFMEFEKSLFHSEERTSPISNLVTDALMVKREFLDEFDLFSILPNFLITKNFNACTALNTFIYSYIDIYLETRDDVLNFLPDIRNLLDIGCAQGCFGEKVKNTFQIKVDGIELDPINASIASEKLDTVFNVKFENAQINGTYNCLSCLDVLEHIENTDSFFEKAYQFIENNGYLVLSVPNAGHWSVVYDLLGGHLDYVPCGIMCVTHLRFFTEKSIILTLKRNNFKSIKIYRQQNPIPESKSELFKNISRTHHDTNLASLNTSGFLILAQKL